MGTGAGEDIQWEVKVRKAYIPRGALDMKEAVKFRRMGYQIWGCWWCVTKGDPRPYWAAEETKFFGHRIACPNHSKLGDL